jgi:flagellar basal-body rod protein FlgC
MDYSKAFAISAAGMSFERTRVEIAAMNLANANTVQGPGAAYQPLRVVALGASTGADFGRAVARELDGVEGSHAGFAMPQVSIVPSNAAPRQVYEPGNPLADAKGYVSYAGVDSAAEMVAMMSAMRSYEANVAAMNMSKTLALKALNIGGSAS